MDSKALATALQDLDRCKVAPDLEIPCPSAVFTSVLPVDCRSLLVQFLLKSLDQQLQPFQHWKALEQKVSEAATGPRFDDLSCPSR